LAANTGPQPVELVLSAIGAPHIYNNAAYLLARLQAG
jgi:hypothetical protein